MTNYSLKIRQTGERTILIEWPQRIEDSILDDIISFKNLLIENQDQTLSNYTSAYASILLHYHKNINFEESKKEILKLYNSEKSFIKQQSREWHIPVCYHESLALDLDLFTSKNISHKELIHSHTESEYRVYMIGFLPGFLYLGGLPKQLHLPRKSTPNLKTPKGAIAIGGEQTGIYPMESPGGWNVIGRTPLNLFDIGLDPPTVICQGDKVKFYEIDLETYEILK